MALTRQRLTDLLDTPATLTPAERAEAGRILSELYNPDPYALCAPTTATPPAPTWLRRKACWNTPAMALCRLPLMAKALRCRLEEKMPDR